MRKTGGNTELMTLVLTEGEEGCCKYLDIGGEREGSYYMPLYLHSLSIWLQLQRSAEGVLYLTQPQAHFVSLDRPWLRQPNIPKLSLENKLCRKTKKRSFVATKWIFFFFPPSRCANLDILKIRPPSELSMLTRYSENVSYCWSYVLWETSCRKWDDDFNYTDRCFKQKLVRPGFCKLC